MGRIIGYMRLSSSKSLDKNGFNRQKEPLKTYNCTEFVEDVVSGTIRERKGLNSMLASLQEGDTVIISNLDRMARNTAHLLEIVETIKQKGAVLKSVNDSWLDTSADNPMSDFLLTVMGGMAQLERDLIAQRTREGIELARSKGVKFGRPAEKTKQIDAAIKTYDAGGMTGQQIADSFGISRSTLYKALKERDLQKQQ